MDEKGPAARKRLLFRRIQWRIIAFQVPVVLFLMAAAFYWLEGHLDRVLGDTCEAVGRRSVLLAAASVRHSMNSGRESPQWSWIEEGLAADDDSQIEIVSLESKVLYASDPSLRGRTYSRFTDSPCRYCHSAGSPRASAESRIITEPGRKSSRVFATPLPNSPDCMGCHRDDGPKLGMVYFGQPLSPLHQTIRTWRAGLILFGVGALGFTVLSTRTLLGRYFSRPRLQPALVSPPQAPAAPPERAVPAAPSGIADEAAQLRESLQQIEQQRDELGKLYFITDQLSRSIQPNLVSRRAVELAGSVFGSVCVLVAGHFHPDSRSFHGTVTYHGPGGEIIERPYPDDDVKQAAPYFDGGIVERWLRGELDGLVRLREEVTVAYPLERHGRRLGLLLAPARGRHESHDGRPTAAHPEVVQVARKHLAIALEMSELQRERLQQERLAAIGQTVAGLSHCMKNTLNGLKGGRFIIERGLELENPEKLRKGLTVLNSSIGHIERLTHDMLFYAADRPLDFKPANPNDIMREIVELLEQDARSRGIDLRADFDESMEPVPVDRHALYRAILNLVTNAVDACVESDRGSTVIVKSRSDTDSILLTVQDNGVGMPEEILRRVTERFFTTKSSKGTGLGLPVVQKIAEQHGGMLSIESAPGQGSSFHLRIPKTPNYQLPPP